MQDDDWNGMYLFVGVFWVALMWCVVGLAAWGLHG